MPDGECVTHQNFFLRLPSEDISRLLFCDQIEGGKRTALLRRFDLICIKPEFLKTISLTEPEAFSILAKSSFAKVASSRRSLAERYPLAAWKILPSGVMKSVWTFCPPTPRVQLPAKSSGWCQIDFPAVGSPVVFEKVFTKS